LAGYRVRFSLNPAYHFLVSFRTYLLRKFLIIFFLFFILITHPPSIPHMHKKHICALSFALLSMLTGHGYAQPMPHVPADHFVVPDGFEVTLWANSPLFYNPTNMDVDAQGRVWVAEGRNYRIFRNEGKGFKQVPEGDRIMVLTDSNGDGKADKSHVFVQDPELIAPLGVAVIDNQVVVSQPPNLLVYTDVNRDSVFDPKVDKKEALLTGFGGQDHDHSLHAVTTGPSGQWYFNAGNAGSHIVTDKDGWTLRVGSVYKGGAPSVTDEGPNQGGKPGLKSDDGHIYVGAVVMRVNPDGTGLRVVGHNMRNSYEETVNSFGDVYQNDNDDPPACRTTWLMEYGNLGFASDDGARKWQTERRPGQAAPIAEWRQEDPGTIPAGDVYGNGSPTGICFYENGALGDDYRGLLLSGEAARNVIFGYLPKPDGAGFTMDRFDFFRSKRADEFPEGQGDKASLATQFRPSDVCVGPDGAIYVADWFDPGVGGHSMKDLDHAAAIYRITRKGDNPRPSKYDINTVEGQIASLKSPANNVRDAGFTRLKAAGEKSLSAVKTLLDDPNEYIQARAVWLLAQLGDNGIAEVEKILSHDDAQMRIAAFRALRFVEHKLLEHATTLAKDPSIAVRREVALALRNFSLEDTQDIILTLASQYKGDDRWYLEAIGTASTNKEAAIYSMLDKELGNEDPLQWSKAFTKLAWRLHPAASVEGFKARALSVKIPLADRKDALTALGFIPDEAAAMAMVAVAEAGPDDTKTLAQWWLQNRSQHVWKSYASQMKGLNKKPNALKANQDYKVPVDGPEITNLDVQEVVALKGDVARGQMSIARCYMCHQVNGTGVEFGPALDQWGLGRSVEAIATAIIHPNEGIAHGFEGTQYVTKDGHTLQGFTLFAGGSVILKVMGGGEVSFSRNLVKSSEPLEKSLMMSAGQLGLAAQDVADIAAYLKAGAPVNPNATPVSTPANTPAKPAAKAQPKAQPNNANKPVQMKKKPVKFDLNDRKAGLTYENAPKIEWGDTTGKKRILFIAGSTTHRHGIHEYKAGSLLLAKALNESGLPVVAKVHWFNWPEDESCFDGVDTIIVYADAGGDYGDKYAVLDEKYQQGTALMFMHYGVHPTVEVGEKYYNKWMGGYFADAFSVNPSWIADMVPKDGHPVARGLSGSIKAFDEFYWNLSFDKSCTDCYPLATGTPTPENMVTYGSSKFWNKDAADKLGTPQSLLWCRDPADAPRGAGFVGGHFHRNWAIDDYRKLILNTIAWVTKVEVPKDGVPSETITREMLNQNLNRPEWPEPVELPTPDLLTQPGGKAPELGPDGRAVQKKRKPAKKK
jgi:putative membrane-bound dehydrogenase-like protein